MNLNKHEIEFYDSIDSMPFDRFNAFNKYIMLDAELGSTIMDFDKKTAKIHQLLAKEMLTEARQEMMNIRNVFHNIMTETNVRGFAFATLIKSIDGVDQEQFDIPTLKKTLSKLSKWGLSGAKVYDTTEDLKKK